MKLNAWADEVKSSERASLPARETSKEAKESLMTYHQCCAERIEGGICVDAAVPSGSMVVYEDLLGW